jgi:hypothetical protein
MLEPPEIGLYLFLALAADKDGLSCWRLDRIERELPCFDRNTLWKARDRLLQLDLVAFKPWRESDPDGSYQVLSIQRTGAVLPPELNAALASLGNRLRSNRRLPDGPHAGGDMSAGNVRTLGQA